MLGEPGYYSKFGFERCKLPICPFDKNNAHFQSMRNAGEIKFTISYETEFKTATKPVKINSSVRTKKKRRSQK